MRHRIKDYQITVIDSNTLYIDFNRPQDITLSNVLQSIRLVIDESEAIPLTHSMKKQVVNVSDLSNSTYNTRLTITGNCGNILDSDNFTIEVDWGLSAEDIKECDISYAAALQEIIGDDEDSESQDGKLPGYWRTLTSDEWRYLLTQRTNAANLKSIGTVNGVRGCIYSNI